MSFAPAALLEFLAIAVAIPAVTLGLAILRGGVPAWMRPGGRGASGREQAQPGIQSFLMLALLLVVDLALVFVLPLAVAFGGLPSRDTAVEGAFLAALILVGAGYAWRRGVLRWR
jgi:hypothetical protein